MENVVPDIELPHRVMDDLDPGLPIRKGGETGSGKDTRILGKRVYWRSRKPMTLKSRSHLRLELVIWPKKLF